MTDCGGCQGQGAHKRWCEQNVGRAASMRGLWSDRAESLGDSVGANNPGAANHLYAAARLLRDQANEMALRHIARTTESRHD